MSKVYFITGASSGFGHALAKAALERGDKAVLTARRENALIKLAEMYPDTALALVLDVTEASQRRESIQLALNQFGRLDVLANIAGRGSLGAAEEFSPEQLRDQMEINFFAAVEMTRAVLPAMRKQAGGHILNLTSIGGLAAVGGFGPYCASKFALEGWTEALRDEVRPLGIKVTIVEPGAFRTEFAGTANMRPEQRLEVYRNVIEPIENYLYGSDGQQPGDPRKAANAMITVVEDPQPPLRLLLGSDAFGLWEKKYNEMEKDFQRWRFLGEATAFDGVEVKPVGG